MERMSMTLSGLRQSVRCPARFLLYQVREKLLLQRLGVRQRMWDLQRHYTHVLPNADVKIFLTADAHVRAVRRYEEFIAKGVSCRLENVEREVIERDERDMNRAIAPLKQAEDAVRVDTSAMTIEEVVCYLKNLIGQAVAR